MAEQVLPQWPELMSVDTLARYTDISKRTIQSLIASGEIPTVRIGGRRLVRVRRRDFDTWVDTQRLVGTAGVNAILDEIRAGRH